MMLLLFAAQALYVGNGACSSCHTKIFDAYTATPMALSSGRVSGGMPPGSFRHENSGVEYRMQADGGVRAAKARAQADYKLDYFIGSGAAGRSYLYSRAGFLFQAPVTWYSVKRSWDVSPGFESDGVSRWNRPIEPSCLSCHASQLRVLKGTQNGYGDPPFTQSGVGCERCHGPGSLHVQGLGKLVNPATLGPARRDSVCMQCHLSGEVRVARAGRELTEYRPGDRLTDFATYFVRENRPALKATSHVEKLQASRCKQSAGDRLWCGTCHDPHTVPNPSGRASWYRGKCLQCHQSDDCRRGDDCVSCHMPKGRVTDGGHGVLTDHGIPRREAQIVPQPKDNDSWRLLPFAHQTAGDRELGLAFAEAYLRTKDPRQRKESVRLLAAAPRDAEVEVRLADLLQRGGDENSAASLYRAALRKVPDSVAALVNLGSIYAKAGRFDEAIPLWRDALKRNPCLPEAGKNLATALKAQGKEMAAEQIRKAQAFCVVE